MSASPDLDIIVIGAGVVGLAIARQAAISGKSVAVLDRHSRFGEETSSRNSEVIHAGIYYPQGSLKAMLCAEGRDLLYDYCRTRSVGHRKCGKLIVASGKDAESGLEKIKNTAAINNVSDLRMLTPKKVTALEPEICCDYALISPSTGIIDSHALMLSYIADLEEHGGMFVPCSDVVAIEYHAGRGFAISLAKADEKVTARELVNSAGLMAGRVASRIDALTPEFVPNNYYARGAYFRLQSGKRPFQRLIYPLPDSASLGIHATLDLSGSVRFGPDVEWIDDPEDYEINPARAQSFIDAIRNYWPALPDDALVPDYAGIRPKLAPAGDASVDFRIDGSKVHGIPGLVNLFGIESPGLTSSIAVGKYVEKLLF